jgi:biotin carboxyl carrier protein
MKQYKITVNGQSYDVSVEELQGSSSAAGKAVSQAQPAPTATPAVAAVAPQQTAPSPGAVSVKSPMPGTVMSFKVSVGQMVKRGDVLLILEAMKMENEIVAPQAGKVAALRVSVSASVNTGDPLVDLE